MKRPSLSSENSSNIRRLTHAHEKMSLKSLKCWKTAQFRNRSLLEKCFD
ncbi:hypothetical protein FOQG_17424 [Fusarium oxysporum f. sp. raphani 54005]|uniref:Uncharacterized protein n=1 Tax=Fusarium oxysporum f. sp. raphani 54005 TaxID=1089458 RepID=X0C543_FUSOX|nr:hypothetical protein FOQG_17424 [Fusarium oxysporum f. sp. raphani 54005]